MIALTLSTPGLNGASIRSKRWPTISMSGIILWAGHRVAPGVMACFFLVGLWQNGSQAAQSTNPPRAQLKISGNGLPGNWGLKRILFTLDISKTKPPFFGPSFVEDASLILSSRIKRDGF